MQQELVDLLGTELGAVSDEPLPPGRIGDVLSMDLLEDAARQPVIDVNQTSGSDVFLPNELDSAFRLPRVQPQDAEAHNRLGVEAIACYVSFHYSARSWGIYISYRRLAAIASIAFRSIPRLTDADRLGLALSFVMDHERFHYWTDVAAAHMELASRRPIYVPYLRAHPDVHTSSLAQLEEALANVRAYRRLTDRDVKDAAWRFMAGQPVGYRDWHNYRYSAEQLQARRELGLGIHASAMPSWPRIVPFEWFFDEHRTGASSGAIPLRWIGAPQSGWAFLGSYARPVEIDESSKFATQLAKMPADIQRMWREKTRPRLEQGQIGGTDFKKIGADLFRCRVGLHYRVHLMRTSGTRFLATQIGARQTL